MSSRRHASFTHDRHDQPVYVLPSNRPQPSCLLPMKAAAYQQYPNFFNASCYVFGSINRDLKLQRPACILRVSKVALDLSKVDLHVMCPPRACGPSNHASKIQTRSCATSASSDRTRSVRR